MSRWTSPRACAASSAPQTWARTSDAHLRLEGALALDHRAQVGALDVAHRDVELPLLLARLVERDHVRVLDLGGDLGLVLEPLAERRVGGQVGRDQLQRHLPVEPQLGSAVDDAHAAPAGDRLEPVPGDLRADCCLSHSRVYSVRQ